MKRDISNWRSAKYVRFIVRTAFALVVLAVVGLVWPARLGGSSTFVMVHGNSMAPAYRDGDLVIARTQDRYAPGDVVLLRVRAVAPSPTNPLVVHRIRDIDSDGNLVTQGDNRSTADNFNATVDDVFGVTTQRIPHVGNLIWWMSRWWVLAAIVGVCCARSASDRYDRQNIRKAAMST